MRDDTLGFNQLWIANFFNFSARSCDPFLIQTSIVANQSVGGGARSIAQLRRAEGAGNEFNKVLIPLNDQTVQKAKACQEMIMYERQDQGRVLTAEEIQTMNEQAQSTFLFALNSSQPPPIPVDQQAPNGAVGAGESFMEPVPDALPPREHQTMAYEASQPRKLRPLPQKQGRVPSRKSNKRATPPRVAKSEAKPQRISPAMTPDKSLTAKRSSVQ